LASRVSFDDNGYKLQASGYMLFSAIFFTRVTLINVYADKLKAVRKPFGTAHSL
jgi:hypothetical protein